jgi:hypothetical protein
MANTIRQSAGMAARERRLLARRRSVTRIGTAKWGASLLVAVVLAGMLIPPLTILLLPDAMTGWMFPLVSSVAAATIFALIRTITSSGQ